MCAMLRRLIFGAAMFCFVMGQFATVQASSFAYVVAKDYGTANGPDLFGTVNLTTGGFTLISDLSTPGYDIFGMGFGPDGQIYGVGFNKTNFSLPGEFFSINPLTGATSDLGSIPFNPSGAASGPNGTLYAIDFTTSNSESLYAISPPSNASNLIGSVPFSSDGLVAIDSQGHLFAAGNGDGSFYEVNTASASTTLIGNTGLGTSLYAGTFVGDTLYGFSSVGTSDTIVTIDTSNASVTTGPLITFNGSTNSDYAVVAAASPFAVPEPSSIILGLIGALGVLTYRTHGGRHVQASRPGLRP